MPLFVAHRLETPPLTRGRRSRTSRSRSSRRNTPAYAGKTRAPECRSRSRRKHPRLRGEDSTASRRTPSRAETPPLTRGRPSLRPISLERSRKHPRLRGEDDCRTAGLLNVVETPPLTRGRPRDPFWRDFTDRNTPAYAGKTHWHSSKPQTHWKHPRLRGEDKIADANVTTGKETPPLTRGRRRRSQVRPLLSRNTPAYAGKTGEEGSTFSGVEKHPRLRGEDRDLERLSIL